MEESIVEFVKHSSNSITDVSEIAQKMKILQLSLADLIEMLEPSLTSYEERDRHRATLLIACLLENDSIFSGNCNFNNNSLHLFVVFFCRRIQDFPSIGPCLQALTTIVRRYAQYLEAKNCDILDIVQTVSKSVHIPSYAQTIRFKTWELLSTMIEHSLLQDQLQQIGSLFLECLAIVVEGEKDPRCLLQALKTLHLSLISLQSHLAETIPNAEVDDLTVAERIFDNICCYFPISFNPPENDTLRISPEMLNNALLSCMCTTNAIASLAIPFLLEQLIENETAEARISALQYLTEIVRNLTYCVLHNQPKTSQKMVIDDDHNEVENESEKWKKESYFSQLTNVLFELFQFEANEAILNEAFRFCREVTAQMCRVTPIAKDCPEAWQMFQESLLEKVVKEIKVNCDSLKTQNGWKLCVCLGMSGGWQSALWLGQRVAPLLWQEKLCRETQVHFLHQQKKLFSAIDSHVQILPVLATQERVSPACVALLDSCITVVSQQVSRDTSSIDVSQMAKRLDFFYKERAALCDTLLTFMKLNYDSNNISKFADQTAVIHNDHDSKENYHYRMEEEAVECVSLTIKTLQNLFSLTGVDEVMESRFTLFVTQLFSLYFYADNADILDYTEPLGVIPNSCVGKLENWRVIRDTWADAACQALTSLCVATPAYHSSQIGDGEVARDTWREQMLDLIVKPLVSVLVRTDYNSDKYETFRRAQATNLLQNILSKENNFIVAGNRTFSSNHNDCFIQEVTDTLFSILNSTVDVDHVAVESLLTVLVDGSNNSNNQANKNMENKVRFFCSFSKNSEKQVVNLPIIQLVRAVSVLDTHLSDSGMWSLAQLIKQCILFSNSSKNDVDSVRCVVQGDALVMEGLIPLLTSSTETLNSQRIILWHSVATTCLRDIPFFSDESGAFRLSLLVFEFWKVSQVETRVSQCVVELFAALINKLKEAQEVSRLLSQVTRDMDFANERFVTLFVTVTNALLWRHNVPRDTSVSWQEFLIRDALVTQGLCLATNDVKSSNNSEDNNSVVQILTVSRHIPLLFSPPPLPSNGFNLSNTFWRQKTFLILFNVVKDTVSRHTVKKNTEIPSTFTSSTLSEATSSWFSNNFTLSQNSSTSTTEDNTVANTSSSVWTAMLLFFSLLGASSNDNSEYLVNDLLVKNQWQEISEILLLSLSILNNFSNTVAKNSNNNTSLYFAARDASVSVLQRFLFHNPSTSSVTHSETVTKGFLADEQLHLILPLLFTTLLTAKEAKVRLSCVAAMSCLLPHNNRPAFQFFPAKKDNKEATVISFRSLFPYKRSILKILLIASDDKKRVVRHAAATLRNAFLLFLAQEESI